MAFYIKKTFVDAEPGIELVNIHYTWTPVGEMPNWEAHRETRMMPRGATVEYAYQLLRTNSPLSEDDFEVWDNNQGQNYRLALT